MIYNVKTGGCAYAAEQGVLDGLSPLPGIAAEAARTATPFLTPPSQAQQRLGMGRGVVLDDVEPGFFSGSTAQGQANQPNNVQAPQKKYGWPWTWLGY